MNSNYYIQNIKGTTHKSYDDDISIDRVMNFEYMGSAEFEFGAVPKSIEMMVNNVYRFSTIDVEYSKVKKTFYCFLPKSISDEEMQVFLKKAAAWEIRTKEQTHLDCHFYGSGRILELQREHSPNAWMNLNTRYGSNKDEQPWFISLDKNLTEYFALYLKNRHSLQENQNLADYLKEKFDNVSFGTKALIPNPKELGLIEMEVKGFNGDTGMLTFKNYNKKINIHYSLVHFI